MAPWRARLRQVLEAVRNHSQVSSLHGLRHIVKEGVSYKERLFWLALVLSCGAELISICLHQWSSFRRVPTETVLTDSAVSIQGRFPCVGLCPMHQMDWTAAMPLLRQASDRANKSFFGDTAHSLDPDERENVKTTFISDADLEGIILALHKLVSTSAIAAAPIFQEHVDTLMHLDDHVNLVDFMKRVLPTCDHFFHSCLWRGMPFDCCKYFSLRPTELGYCYFFMVEEANRMVCAEAFPDQEDQKAQCLAVQDLTSYGPNSGLRVYLHTSVDPDTVVDDKLTGVLATLTLGRSCVATRMNVEGRPAAVPAGAYSLMMKEIRTEFSSDMVGLRPEERGCYFEDEWPGSTPQNRKNFPKTYSELHCLVMCKRQFVLEACKCLPYPLTLGDPNTPCLLSKTPECIQNISDWTSFVRPRSVSPGFSPAEYSHGVRCDSCLPTCASSRYVVDVRTPWAEGHVDALAHLTQRTMLDVFFPGPNAAVLYTVMRTFSMANLLVTFGGLANLFLGMSYITLLELVVLVAKCGWVLFVRQWCLRGRRALPVKPSYGNPQESPTV